MTSMNIFYLSNDPADCAKQHCDAHIRKMIVEYAQMLSTAHRLCDGHLARLGYVDAKTDKHRYKDVRLLADEFAEVTTDENGKYKVAIRNKQCYSVTHANHPQSIWTRTSSGNYLWLLQLLEECLKEYTFRWGKVHATTSQMPFLRNTPKNIRIAEFVRPTATMPDEYKQNYLGSPDVIASYKNFYVGSKSRFAKWTKREVPTWFKERIQNYVESNFYRTPKMG
jgi:hypothetical protein